jgi:hypothetical protein
MKFMEVRDMSRRTVTIADVLYRELQKMRAKFIEADIVDDMSFTTAVNVVLLGGLIATDRFTDEDWELIHDFLVESGRDLELESLTDRRADAYLENLRRVEDNPQ